MSSEMVEQPKPQPQPQQCTCPPPPCENINANCPIHGIPFGYASAEFTRGQLRMTQYIMGHAPGQYQDEPLCWLGLW